jgi:hypothetical protein
MLHLLDRPRCLLLQHLHLLRVEGFLPLKVEALPLLEELLLVAVPLK